MLSIVLLAALAAAGRAERYADLAPALAKARTVPRNLRMERHRLRMALPGRQGSLPQMLDGVPATLATIPVQQTDTAPKLKPFPNWESNTLGNCSALQFVQNIEIDKNGVMWILDNGRIGTLTQTPNSKCPPSLVLIDLKSGKNEMERIPFPSDILNANTTYLNDLVVDNRDGDYAYITDNSAVDPGIIVFRRSNKKSWKIRDMKSMMSVPEASAFRINGTSVSLPVNVDGIALGPQFLTADQTVDRTIYYCPLSSFHLYAINASVLRNDSIGSTDGAIRPYVVDLGTKASQTDGMKMDSTGVLFFGLVGNSTIAEWNTTTDFRVGQRTIARDPNYIQWVDRFTFDDHGNVYVVINRLYNFVKNQVSTSEVNYRILKSHTGTKSYIYAEEIKPAGLPGAAAAPTFAASLLLVALAHLLA
ncbi:hypothetical protein ACJJTC_011849 [Scirpophaga incertulas]